MSRTFATRLNSAALFLCLWTGSGTVCGQQPQPVLRAHRPLSWPHSKGTADIANKLPAQEIDRFLNSLGEGPPAEVAGKVVAFRFIQLEPGLFGLALVEPVRWAPVEVVTPVGDDRFRVFPLQGLPMGGLLATALVDLGGSGSYSLILASPVALRGAFTDPIYWYRIYQWSGGQPQDVSARFPEFYRESVLPDLEYLGRWLQLMKGYAQTSEFAANFGPGAPDVQLAQIEFVRLRFQHLILGNTDVGLSEALDWTRSPNTDISLLGVQSLSEMSSSTAWGEIDKLRQSNNYPLCVLARSVWFNRLRTPEPADDQCQPPKGIARNDPLVLKTSNLMSSPNSCGWRTH